MILETEMKSAREAANGASKSSVGDKHETGKAMAQLTQENLSKQLEQLKQLEFAVSRISPKIICKKVQSGAIVETEALFVYIGVPIRKMSLNDKKVYGISEVSPIGKALMGKSKGEHFSLNGKDLEILDLI